MMLGEKDLLQELRRHWDYTGKDEDVAHEKFREWRRQYPARLRFHTRRITH